MAVTIYEALRESHEAQRGLCRRLVRVKDDAGRKEVMRELRIELAAHAAAEERFLYVPMLQEDMGLNSSRHALHEHHKIDECVEDLQKAKLGTEHWQTLAKKLSKEVHHHLKEEETKFFQVSGKILSETQKTKLAGQYQKDYLRMKKLLSES
jgi:hemerythrin superfamily protein